MTHPAISPYQRAARSWTKLGDKYITSWLAQPKLVHVCKYYWMDVLIEARRRLSLAYFFDQPLRVPQAAIARSWVAGRIVLQDLLLTSLLDHGPLFHGSRLQKLCSHYITIRTMQQIVRWIDTGLTRRVCKLLTPHCETRFRLCRATRLSLLPTFSTCRLRS